MKFLAIFFILKAIPLVLLIHFLLPTGHYDVLLMLQPVGMCPDPHEMLRESGQYLHSRSYQELSTWLASNRLMLVCAGLDHSFSLAPPLS